MKKNAEWYDKNVEVYRKLSEKVKIIICEILENEKIPFHNISIRVKTKKGFLEKIVRKNYKNIKKEFTDIIGVRIIGYVDSDIHLISEVIRKNFKIDEVNSKDQSELLGEDKVGYKSIHYVAELDEKRTYFSENKKFIEKKFEIQIRTILQHAWAEIEHDKNYKFSGELPAKIKRRFKVLAGVLELADDEFNRLAFEIDEYENYAKQQTKDNELNIEINTTTLKEFLRKEFNEFLSESDNTLNKNGWISEVSNFGIKKIAGLSDIIPKDYKQTLREYGLQTTYMGILRDLLIINDHQKYFEKSWNNSWSGFEREDIELYDHYKIPLDDLTKKYNVYIESYDESEWYEDGKEAELEPLEEYHKH